jgi:hypothetical protein
MLFADLGNPIATTHLENALRCDGILQRLRRVRYLDALTKEQLVRLARGEGVVSAAVLRVPTSYEHLVGAGSLIWESMKNLAKLALFRRCV